MSADSNVQSGGVHSCRGNPEKLPTSLPGTIFFPQQNPAPRAVIPRGDREKIYFGTSLAKLPGYMDMKPVSRLKPIAVFVKVLALSLALNFTLPRPQAEAVPVILIPLTVLLGRAALVYLGRRAVPTVSRGILVRGKVAIRWAKSPNGIGAQVFVATVTWDSELNSGEPTASNPVERNVDSSTLEAATPEQLKEIIESLARQATGEKGPVRIILK